MSEVETGEEQLKERARQNLLEYDRLVARGAETNSPPAPLSSGGPAHTTHEARDRAAHTQSWVAGEAARESGRGFNEQAELARLDKELFPTEEARREWERGTGPRKPPPAGTQERQQHDDLRQLHDKERHMAEIPPDAKAAAAAAAKNLSVQGDVQNIPSIPTAELGGFQVHDLPGFQRGVSIDKSAPIVQPKAPSGPDKG